jgi:hypothetical protein
MGCSVSDSTGGQVYGTLSDSLGRYSLTLPAGPHVLVFSFVGYELSRRKVTVAQGKTVVVNVGLADKVLSIREFSVESNPDEAPPTVQKLESQDLSRIPTVYADVMRSVQILPGITANNELSSAYNVRGGNYDENLIYLNGYEINRPFLLRQGVEENQSLINPDMVDGLQFYGGAFPANYGDKMSSVLAVDYVRDQPEGWGGVVRADLLSQGVTVRNRTGRLSWSAGTRYSNPNLFVSKLQTSGTYRPQFADLQLLGDYTLPGNSHLELFLLGADNQFRLTPQTWTGNFTVINYQDVRAVQIQYQGQRVYTYGTTLAGLRYTKLFSPKSHASLSLSRYATTEHEDTDLRGDIYYNPNAWESDPGYYLKSRFERVHDRLALTSYEIQTAAQFESGSHTVQAGASLRLVDMNSHVDEFLQEQGDSSVETTPIVSLADRALTMNSVGGYARDVIAFGPLVHADLGVRALNYAYNRETLISPRAGLHVFANERNTVSFSYGWYYQPPFFYELRTRDPSLPPLKSERAIHYVLEYEHQYARDVTLRAEAFYKQLDRLIPYNFDEMRLIYGDYNNANGYAYGFDVLVHGELSQHVNSWISYGYLDTRERIEGDPSGYHRGLLDQRHTLRLFLQDRMEKHSNIQAHNRLLFGSGYLYHPQTLVTDATGKQTVVTDYSTSKTFPFYFRDDVGFSVRLKFGKRGEAIILAEVLNAFNRANVASYTFYPIFPSSSDPVKIPEVLSGRFFNLGATLEWK